MSYRDADGVPCDGNGRHFPNIQDLVDAEERRLKRFLFGSRLSTIGLIGGDSVVVPVRNVTVEMKPRSIGYTKWPQFSVMSNVTGRIRPLNMETVRRFLQLMHGDVPMPCVIRMSMSRYRRLKSIRRPLRFRRDG